MYHIPWQRPFQLTRRHAMLRLGLLSLSASLSSSSSLLLCPIKLLSRYCQGKAHFLSLTSLARGGRCTCATQVVSRWQEYVPMAPCPSTARSSLHALLDPSLSPLQDILTYSHASDYIRGCTHALLPFTALILSPSAGTSTGAAPAPPCVISGTAGGGLCLWMGRNCSLAVKDGHLGAVEVLSVGTLAHGGGTVVASGGRDAKVGYPVQ